MSSINLQNGKIKVDMHIHTSASDGTWKPDILIEKVIQKNIGIFSITDHDSIENVKITSSICDTKEKLIFIPGIEITSSFEGRKYHILGYGIDPDNQSLQKFINENKTLQEINDEQSFELYQCKSPKISYAEYLEYRNNPERGGWKSLNYLIDKGLCTTMGEYFELTQQWGDMFGKLVFPLPNEVCKIIIEAGGIPVLAHPGVAFYDQDFEYIVKELFELGIKGIECFHSSNSQAVIDYCLEFCSENRLIITGGSDCHGEFIQSRVLGYPDIYLKDLNLGKLI